MVLPTTLPILSVPLTLQKYKHCVSAYLKTVYHAEFATDVTIGRASLWANMGCFIKVIEIHNHLTVKAPKWPIFK